MCNTIRLGEERTTMGRNRTTIHLFGRELHGGSGSLKDPLNYILPAAPPMVGWLRSRPSPEHSEAVFQLEERNLTTAHRYHPCKTRGVSDSNPQCWSLMLELEELEELVLEDANTYQDWLGGTTRGTGVGATTADGVAAASNLLGKPRSCNSMKAVKALQESILTKVEKIMI
jgi:hypothetical protein